MSESEPTSPRRNFETLAVRTQVPRTGEREHSVPLLLTSSFVFDSAEHARALVADEVDGNVFSRDAKPNTDEFVHKLRALEAAEDGIATASGMAAVFTALASRLSAGDDVLASHALFGGTHQLLTRILPKWGVTWIYTDATNPDSWTSQITPATRMLFEETPSIPGLELVDLAWLAHTRRSTKSVAAITFN